MIAKKKRDQSLGLAEEHDIITSVSELAEVANQAFPLTPQRPSHSLYVSSQRFF